MTNPFYNSSGQPSRSAPGNSAAIRGEFAAIAAGFEKLPELAGNDGKLVRIQGGVLEAWTPNYLTTSTYTAADVLAKLLTVDGAGSGLDANLFDGNSSTAFLRTVTASIASGADLNAFTTQGVHFQQSNLAAAAGTNYPVPRAGMLQVLTPTAAFVYQTYQEYDSGDTWSRSGYNSVWSAWRKHWNDGNDGGGSGLNADMLDGYPLDAGAASPSTVAGRNTSGDIHARLIRQTYPDQASISGGLVFRANNTTDNFLRVCSDLPAIRVYLDAPSRGGSGASGTWGISISGNAATATNATNAANAANAANASALGGLSLPSASLNNEVNKVVRTNASGYAYFGWINTISGNAGTNPIARVYASADDFLRYYTLANFTAQVLNEAGLSSNAYGTRTVSTVAPSGGVDGDIWYVY